MNRREFLFSAGAATLMAGCRTRGLFGSPDLSFGVVSDIHITTPKSCRLFERALRYLKRRGVNAVMIPGDLTDWGLLSNYRCVKETWDRVFAGTDVVPLFCTGNHDYDGWAYTDIRVEMQANGYSDKEAFYFTGLAKGWKEVFGEEFAAIRCRTVKGYSFVSGEWGGYKELGKWMEKHGAALKGEKPFFYFQHPPIKGTTSDSTGWADNGATKPVLDAYPNCVAFTGHAHRPFYDEGMIWQGAFTAIGTPSLSYACPTGQHENGNPPKGTTPSMQMEPTRLDLRGGQGYFVDVWPDRIAVERVDFEEEDSDQEAWVIPLPLGKAKPYDPAARAKALPAPAFPAGAGVEVETRNGCNRRGGYSIVMNCEFPSARMPKGLRVFDYEIRAVPADGSEPMVKRFLSPAYAKMEKYEPARQRFWFDVKSLPTGKDYRLEVYARNSFGAVSKPIRSGVLRAEPYVPYKSK